MRHRQVLAVATVALFGLSGCADRPNDLDTYYDDPTPTPAAEPAQPSATPRAASVPTPASTPVTAPAAVSAALLTDDDVAEEEVVPGEGKVSGCLTGLTRGTSRSATWSYASGSTLEHQVTEYPGGAADVVAQADCEGKKLTVTKQSGVEVQRAWCEGTTCTVLLAKGKLVSALRVTAGTEARATDAAKRLLSIVAKRLRAA